jgi:hypothetical protein
MLEKIAKGSDLTVESLAAVLNAVHQEGMSSPTQYSNIFDLKKGVAYFYDRHRYDRVARVDVAETIKTKQPPKRMKDLFPPKKGE